jgi:lipopolysaccharide export system protein LptA
MPFFKQIIALTFFILSVISLYGQQKSKIELLGANSLKFDKALGVDAQRLIGNVRFRHEGAYMYCDSAYLYNRSNSLDAFGNVRIVQGDTLTLLSDRLHYEGNSQTVMVRDNVVLKDAEMTLRTHTLDYFRPSKQAIFYDRGTIVSTVNQNKLVACEGIYDSGSERFFYRDSVVLENPRYRVETDTLHYHSKTETAYFFGPSFIYSEENTIYCETGWYDTSNDVAQFGKNAFINNGTQVLRGDSIWYTREEGLGKAYRNVSITDTVDQYLISGDYGEYREKSGRNFVTGHAEMIQFDLTDSLFLHGDTLLALRDTIRGDQVFAYPGVKFFRKDIQGAADSLVYAPGDSLIRMFHEPALWSENLQITGDTILLRTFDGVIDKLFVYDHAFMVNRLDSTKYNQIKGKRLTGFFRDNDLYRVLIRGNGESLYYAEEDAKKDTVPSPPKYIGVNKAICSNIEIFLENRTVKRVKFITKPEGVFYPLEQFPKDLYYFDGFKWEGIRRPEDRFDIFTEN